MLTLADRYTELCSTPSDIWLHLPKFVEMVDRLDAKVVVELGTRSGVSTVAWLHALEQTGGHLFSVDIDSRPELGEWPHWTFIQGDDLDPNVLAQLPAADVVFIDTSHAYEQTVMELNVYKHVVRRGGLIVCHDTELARPDCSPRTDPLYPVKRAVEEFVTAEGLQWTNHPESWGLAVIEM